jgi:hypothetical protein
MQGMFGGLYGGAESMPVFVRATVREVLGFQGASFVEPMMQMPGLTYAVAMDRVMPALRQMAKKVW